MLNTNYTDTLYFDIQRVVGGKVVKLKIYRQKKKTIILPSYMTAEYIERLKSGHQCSETFINGFVTPHLHQRISVFAHSSVTLIKVCALLP